MKTCKLCGAELVTARVQESGYCGDIEAKR